MVLNALHFEECIKGADLIITGEGKLDKQTGMGKTPSGILLAASKQNIPVVAIGGSIEETEELNNYGFLSVLSIQPGVITLEQAMEKEFAMSNITRTLKQYLSGIKHFIN